MKNILVVNPNWLGDAIFTAPVFEALKVNYPEARVACLAAVRTRGILEHMEHIDEIIDLNEQGWDRGIFRKLGLIFELKSKKYDAVFFLHRSRTRTMLTWAAGIPIRVGYETKKRKKYLTHAIAPVTSPMHRSDEYLNVLEGYGLKVANRTITLTSDPKDDSFLESQGIRAEDYVIAVHAGANWNLKRWPIERFAGLIDALMSDLGVKVVLTGSKQDESLAYEIIAAMKGEPPIVLTGKTTLDELMGVFKRADVVISADSGPLHMANSLGTAVVGLFGPTRPEITGPRGAGENHIIQHDVGCNAQACYFLECPDNICMKAISIKDVVDVIRQIKS